MIKEINSKYCNQEIITKYDSNVKVLKAFNNNTLLVCFNDTFEKIVNISNYKKGNITSPYCKTVLGVGFYGEGIFERTHNGKATKEYVAWSGMLRRCYNFNENKKSKLYENIFICEEWHNFQNFAKWYSENYYKVGNKRMTLDKDILVKNNKIYSPKTCLIVPDFINKLFITGKSRRGECFIGVIHDSKNSYRVLFSKNGVNCNFGSFKTEKEAFLMYKKEKEIHIKELANKYICSLPKNVYDALCKYEVDMLD